MFGAIARKLFGTTTSRYLKTLHKTVQAINAAEPAVAALSDAELRARTDWLRKRLGDGETLEDIQVDAFATPLGPSGSVEIWIISFARGTNLRLCSIFATSTWVLAATDYQLPGTLK